MNDSSRTRLLRRTTTGAAVVLAGMIAATSQALATPIADGTSNTIQFGVTAPTNINLSGGGSTPTGQAVRLNVPDVTVIPSL